MTAPEILILPYDGAWPRIAAPAQANGPGAAVLGRVTLGPGARLGACATVRADGESVRIGADAHLGARTTVHIARDRQGTAIGDGVTAGPGSVIHACSIGDGCHIGAGAIVLDGSSIGAGAALAQESVVFPRSSLEGGWLHGGAPAAPVRPLGPGELAALHRETRAAGAPAQAHGAPHAATGADRGAPASEAFLFLAATARVAGHVRAEPGVGIWFGCILDGGAQGIGIGENANVQDNAVLVARDAPLSIGRETTIGHNARLTDCTVGPCSLIGIGAVVAPGTVVEADVLLAAGARTRPGQVLASGGLYGGSPARRLRDLDAPRRALIAETWPAYCRYARAFAEAQRAAAAG